MESVNKRIKYCPLPSNIALWECLVQKLKSTIMKDQDEVQQEAIRTLAKMTTMHTNYPGGSNAVDQYAASQNEEKIREALASGNSETATPAPRQSVLSRLLSFLFLLAMLVLMVSGVYWLINFFSQPG